MRLTHGSWLVLIFTAVADEPLRGDPVRDAEADRLAALVKQLGDDDFDVRQKASRALEALGEKILPTLKKAASDADDLETRRRAQQVVRTIVLNARKSRSTGLVTVLVDPGDFSMGSPRNEYNRRADETAHEVRLTTPFLLGAFEVTQDEYQQVTKTNPSRYSPTGAGKGKVAGKETGRFPVEQVTWYDAIAFCNRLSEKDGYEAYYQMADVESEGNSIKAAKVTIRGGNGYRLPTEAEWEYACRAGSALPFFFGSENTGKEANLRPGPAIGYGAAPNWPTHDRTTKVGEYKPNAWGLYDMHGNAAEWCWDWYDKDYYVRSPARDPLGPDSGPHRVLRGGSWLASEGLCRSASRFWAVPDEAKEHVGFRVARTP